MALDVAEQEFQAKVLDESRRRPVVVDFWAEWCGPCRVLGPVLERLESEAGGRWLLAKLDTDRAPNLSRDFRITSIPAVKAFVDGHLATEFVGAIPEPEIRRWLETFVPGPADEAVAEGQQALSQGRAGEAFAAFQRALGSNPRHPRALLALARLDADDGRFDEALARLERITPDDRERLSSEIAALMLLAGSGRAGGLDEIRARAAANPDDLDLQVELGRALAAGENHREALETLLAVVRRSPRKGAGDEARKAMLEVFEAAGSRSELSDEYRSKLALELYR